MSKWYNDFRYNLRWFWDDTAAPILGWLFSRAALLIALIVYNVSVVALLSIPGGILTIILNLLGVGVSWLIGTLVWMLIHFFLLGGVVNYIMGYATIFGVIDHD